MHTIFVICWVVLSFKLKLYENVKFLLTARLGIFTAVFIAQQFCLPQASPTETLKYLMVIDLLIIVHASLILYL